MKKAFILTTAALFACMMFSCKKNDAPDIDTAAEHPGNGRLTVNISSMDPTKADLETMRDYQINSVQIFVFNNENKLETDKFISGLSANNSYNTTLTTLTGAKTVYALLNHPRLYYTPEVSTLASFEADLTDLSVNTPTNMVMSGKNAITVNDFNNNGLGGQPEQAMNIFVKRLASLVELDKITVNFNGTSLEGATFSVNELYLKNVVGRAPQGMDGLSAATGSSSMPILLPDVQIAISDYWYNKITKQASGAPACILDPGLTINANTANTSTNINRMLLAYPNKTPGDTNADSFSPRHTRLIIKAHVTKAASPAVDEDTYYVLTLPVLVANTKYKITDVKITMLGKPDDDDDEDPKVGKISPTITVDPWTGTTELSYAF